MKEGKMKTLEGYSAQYKPASSTATAKSGKGVYSMPKNPLAQPAKGSSLRTGSAEGSQSKMVDSMMREQMAQESCRGEQC